MVIGIITFKSSDTLDWLFLSILIFTAVVCHRNINIVSVVIILFAQLTLDQIIWLVLNESYIFDMITVIIALLAVYQFRYDGVVRIIFPLIILTTASYIYWLSTDYPKPQISWYLWLITSNLFVRYLIFSRVLIVDNYFPKKGQSINLDWIVYKLCASAILIQTLLVIEYLIRHIFNFSEALLIYELYPYLMQGLLTISIWAVFNESYKHLIPRFLKA